ncbi:pilus assembly protein PilY [Ralstonia pickettii]|uniref:Pilus assembly protein PilY n=2 Tax=Ralstonia pickettii TaxID=329 RepID=A0A7X2LD86_RALPI|nr:pilus assembly protein PilY [Ralstonia pickettii]
MKACQICMGIVTALISSTLGATSGSPAGQLPTHVVVAAGGDAWSGKLRGMQFLPTLGTRDATAPQDLWEASRQLRDVAPDARHLWTFHRSPSGVRTPAPLRWAALSRSQQTEIASSDEPGARRVDYVRGIRQNEHVDPTLRPRTSVLGSMRGAHVLLLGPPGVALDASHELFRRQHMRRPWMVYIGANDGMLHGFDALTGMERFAVIPDAVLTVAARNASLGQPASAPICSRPLATDARVGKQWRSILACPNGAMGSGLFLVDITDPPSSTPPPMLAYDASNDAGVGHMTGPIPIVPLNAGGDGEQRWFAVSGNGEGAERAGSRLLLLPLDQPGTALSIQVPPSASQGGLGAPAVALGPRGTAQSAYVADTEGRIWRFDLTGAPPWSQALGTNDAERRTPFFTATSLGGSVQRILSPILLSPTAGGPLLVFTALGADGHATLYGVADTNTSLRNLSRDSLEGLSTREVADGVVIQPGSNSAAGWRIDLPAGQRPDDLTAAGPNSVLLTTRDAADRERTYLLDAKTGLPVSKDGRTGRVVLGAPLITIQSAPPAETPRGGTTQATHTVLWQLDGERVQQLELRTYTRQLGRLSWREVTEAGAR